MNEVTRIALVVLIGALAIFAVEKCYADDWDIVQHNFKIKSDDSAVEFRTNTGSDRDHIQLMQYIDKWELAYRYDDQKAKTEHRFRATYDLVNDEHFYIKPRVEYRYFEGALDDYYRVRSAFGIKGTIAPKTTLYGEFTPMFHYGQGKTSDFDIDETQSKIGINYRVNQTLQLGTFVQYETDNHFNKTGVFLGTAFEVEF